MVTSTAANDNGSNSPADWARWYLTQNINPIPIPYRTKKPIRTGWPDERYSESDVPSAFPTASNIGLLLGANGNGLTDVDLDCDEAVALAPYFLPATGWKIGRSTRPDSHWLYRCADTRTVEFRDPLGKGNDGEKGMIVELRSTGAQVLSAPSVHPDDGETYILQPDGEIPLANVADLQLAVQRLAVTALLARRWPDAGGRHDAALALAGVLLTSGIAENWAEHIVYHAAWAAGDDEATDRKQTVQTTAARLAAGDPITSRAEAEQHFDRKILTRSLDWLIRNCSRAAGVADERPTILVTTDEHVVVDHVIDALGSDDSICQRGGQLVHVVRDAEKPEQITRPDNAPRIAMLPVARLRERITASVRLIEEKQYKDGPKDFPAHPRPWLPQAVASRGNWSGIRPLEGIVQTPVLRPDGTILAIPGYDEATGLIYEPVSSSPISVPDKPDNDDAKQAVATLWDVVSEFPFAEPAKDFSAWLASVLTLTGRFAFPGPSPLFLMHANTPGSGKGLLADVTSEIGCGRALARMPYSANDDEMRKRITSLAVAGDMAVLLDNIDGPLGGAALDAALTAETWEDRLLSTNKVFSGPLHVTWFATANNVELMGDTPRRVLEIKLQTPMENPEERQGFRYPNLKAHVRQHRDGLVQAALTILRGYVVARRPSFSLTPWGSFEGWSDLIRNAVVWCGQSDPGESRMTKASLANQDATVLARLIAGFEQVDPQRQGMVTAQIANLATNSPQLGPLLTDIVTELAGDPSGAVNKRRLGKELAKLCGRVSGALRLTSELERHYKVRLWKVEAV